MNDESAQFDVDTVLIGCIPMQSPCGYCAFVSEFLGHTKDEARGGWGWWGEQ